MASFTFGDGGYGFSFVFSLMKPFSCGCSPGVYGSSLLVRPFQYLLMCILPSTLSSPHWRVRQAPLPLQTLLFPRPWDQAHQEYNISHLFFSQNHTLQAEMKTLPCRL